MGDPDLRALERQVERGSLFTHTVLTEQVVRTNENEAVVNGLVDLLVRGGLVSADDLLEAVEGARRATAEAGQLATVGVALRVDGDSEPPAVVDCERRLPVCQAVCCRLRFALSAEEVESGPLKWDLGRPYFNRQGDDGSCHQLDRETHHCGIYDERPCICREYSCADDKRIWKDFDAMELNHEWIEQNLGATEPRLVEVLMAG
jgi:Fe-S-cluster containining protein